MPTVHQDSNSDLEALLDRTLKPRRPLIRPDCAIRILNGFLEGLPELSVELFGDTLVLFDRAVSEEAGRELAFGAAAFYRRAIPEIRCVWLKTRRKAKDGERDGRLFQGTEPSTEQVSGHFLGTELRTNQGERGERPRLGTDPKINQAGRLLWGTEPAFLIEEHGIVYALDLGLNQDTGFYLDTRLLRLWLKEHAAGKTVFNSFAYTGSLGTAAAVGGAAFVVQTDRNSRFLGSSRKNAAYNGLVPEKLQERIGDYHRVCADARRKGEHFDIAILDPPFFSSAPGGRVDLVKEGARLVNKIRPLVTAGGALVVVNNALFVSGKAWLEAMEGLCAGGYLSIEGLVGVPEDCTGYPETRVRPLPADPAPYAHSTKITILRVS